MPPDSAEARWFEIEVRPHEPLLRAWLRRRFPRTADIDDVIQEAYLRLLRMQPGTVVRSPKAFLFQVARNLAIDQIRRTAAAGTATAFDETTGAAVADGTKIDEGELNRELDLLREAIDALPERCREIFRLRKVEGLTQGEIARRLGISEHTVSAQLTIGFHRCADYVLARAVWRRTDA